MMRIRRVSGLAFGLGLCLVGCQSDGVSSAETDALANRVAELESEVAAMRPSAHANDVEIRLSSCATFADQNWSAEEYWDNIRLHEILFGPAWKDSMRARKEVRGETPTTYVAMPCSVFNDNFFPPFQHDLLGCDLQEQNQLYMLLADAHLGFANAWERQRGESHPLIEYRRCLEREGYFEP